MSEEQDFLRFFGQLVFEEDCACIWEQFTAERREDFCLRAQKAGLGSLFVSRLQERLPETFYRSFRSHYQQESLKRLVEYRDLSHFYRILETANIPFMPIKGADLAFRVYTDQVLRPHDDWDILFRNDDCPRMLELIQEQGWRTPSGYEPKKTEFRHYPVMFNGRNVLEAHWILPHFGNATAEEIWQETLELKSCHRVLTPEMNLLLLAAHTGTCLYAHQPHWRILLDAGMILKHDPVDWEKIHRMADRWGILRPDVLLHVWNDFFPEGVLPPEDPSNEKQQLIREIFATRNVMTKHSRYEVILAADGSHGFRWLTERLKFYNAPQICLKYHIPAHQHGKIILYGIWDLLGKVWYLFARGRSVNPGLRTYCRNVAKLEESLKRTTKNSDGSPRMERKTDASRI